MKDSSPCSRSRASRAGARTPVAWRRRVVRSLAAALGLSVVLSGCRDSPTDPLEGLVAGETDLAALALELPLPSPVFETSASPQPEVVDRWLRSWDEGVLEGRRLRSALYSELGSLLARRHTRAELADEVGLLGAGVRRAGELETSVLPEFLTAGVERARAAYARADRALASRHEEEAWTELIRGADALREVGPEAVARSAVSRVEDRLRRIPGDGTYSEKEWERIRHLVRGGRQALDVGDWGLAIRRAFYAKGLLDGNG